MSDELVIYNAPSSSHQVALRKADSETEHKEREQRIQDALVLEAKLKMINEMIPTRVYNTSSSTAGAGSGDFHQYRMIRRTEQQRVKRIEEEWKKKTEAEEYEAKKRERKQQLDDDAAKRRAKRMKKKDKKKKKASSGNPEAGSQSGHETFTNLHPSGDNEEEEEGEEEDAAVADLD